MADSMLILKEVSKAYEQGSRHITALKPFSLEIKRGEIVALVGASGSGKSTLLHIAGLLLKPDSGEVIIDGKPAQHLSQNAATLLRREKLGFVYQFHHLLPELSAAENISVPLRLNQMDNKEQQSRINGLLHDVGLSDRATHLPSELSGGEQQRIAIARALVHQPALFLADEPTGNLDPSTSKQVEQMMMEMLRKRHSAALIVTHNPDMAARMDRVIHLS